MESTSPSPSSFVKVYPNVHLGRQAVIGDFSILGEPPRGAVAGQIPLKIGDDCQIRSHTVIYAGNVIGSHFQTGHHAFLRESNEIGDDVSIGTKTIIEHHVRIGAGCRIHSQVFIPEFSVVEAACFIGPNVVLTNARYPRASRTKDLLKGPTIREGAKIGAHSTLLPGVEIGRMALVGAGSVVTRDVAAWAIVAGNPARVIGDVRELKYPDGQSVYETEGNP